jgi:hypothetical protein
VTRLVHAFLVVATVSAVGVVAAQALDASDLPQAIENAKTAADHEAIAAYFDEQAKEARAAAARHEKMGATYKKHPPTSPKSGSGHAFHAQMGEHCDDLVSQYEEAARDYEAMAAAHRAEAKAAR